MRSSTVLSVAFVTAAVTIGPVVAAPRPFHDTLKPMAVVGEDASPEPHNKREPWSPSYGVGPVLVPGFCSETGACEQDLQSRAATVMNTTVQQGTLTQDEANKIIQLLQSSEGVQFLQELEADTSSLDTFGSTNDTTNGTVSHSTRSSKTAIAGTVFGGLGALATLGNAIASNLHLYGITKRSTPLFSEPVPYYDFTTPEYPIERGLLSEDSVPYYDFTAYERGLSEDSEDLVARNFANQEAGSVLSALSGLDEQVKRALLEDSEILRRTWLDDLVQKMDQIAVTGP